MIPPLELLVGVDQGEVTVVVTVTVTRVAGTGTTVCTRVSAGPESPFGSVT